MATKKKKDKTPMEKLTEGYEEFMKGRKLNPNGKKLFEDAIKKAAKGVPPKAAKAKKAAPKKAASNAKTKSRGAK
jgi:hypothetical protein